MVKWILEHLCHFVGYELNLGANDDLNRSLRRAHYACNACGLDLLLVDLRAVLDFDAQTGDAVVERFDVFLAAEAFENGRSDRGEVVVRESRVLVCLCEISLLILTARGLEVELGDRKVEYQIECRAG